MLVPNTIAHSSLLDDLRQLGRILTLRRPEPGSLTPNIGKLPWIVLLYCLTSIAFSIALNGIAGGALIDSAVFVGTLSVPFWAVAIIAGLLKWIDRRLDAGSIWLAFTLLLLMLPPAEFIGATAWSIVSGLMFSALASSTSQNFAPWSVGMLAQFVSTLPHIWLVLAGTLFIARNGYGWRHSLRVLFTSLALFAVFTSSVDPLALWQVRAAAPVAGAADGLTIDEEVFYGQPRLLDEHLTRIEPGKPGVPEIFFLGVAGGEEGVFMRETITVEQLF